MFAESIRGLRVLLVEDEASLAQELRERLTRLGVVVVGTVDTAEAAIDAAIRTSPDIVLMDILPQGERDGIAAARDIREVSDVPVVFLTSHSDRERFERINGSVPLGYVLEPFEEHELLVALEMASQRRALASQLRESERRYDQTLRSIGDGVIAADVHGRITFMNPMAEALTGWKLDEAKDKPIDGVLRIASDEGGSQIVSPAMNALRCAAPCRINNLFLISRNSEVIPIDDCAAPITDAEGCPSGVVMAFTDIRERRLAEDALERAREQLHQAQKMESVGRLASGIAHDFNNLLTVINGCAEMALEDPSLSDTMRALLSDIFESGSRAASLTRKFLAFGRQQSLRPQSVDLNVLVSDLAAVLRRLVRSDIKLSLDLAATPVLAFIDPTQVEQVIVNLVVNARDAMPEGGQLELGTRLVQVSEADAREVGAEPGHYAVVIVSDTGMGIDEVAREHIFEPFFTTKAAIGGTGLGLATVYGIAKQSGGSVTVHSVVGQGSTFSVYLPATSAVSTSAPAPLEAQTARAHETILLVEDESPVRSLVSIVLRREGHTVLEAADGSEALDIFAGHGDVQLVVTDMIMPDMPGPQLIARLRAQAPSLRVLYMSGYSSDQLLAAIGHDAFIAKPFTPTALIRKIREVLDHPMGLDSPA